MNTTKLLTASLVAALFSGTPAFAANVENLSTDVLVVGGGGSGLTAAAAAHQAGAKVILMEKLPFIGGSSAFSGGAIAAGDSNAQKREGMTGLSAEGYANIWLNDQKRSFPGGDPTLPD